jgi:hypothetical protein
MSRNAPAQVCELSTIWKVNETGVAGEKIEFPSWEASKTQVPTLNVARLEPEDTPHTVGVVEMTETANPLDEVGGLNAKRAPRGAIGY